MSGFGRSSIVGPMDKTDLLHTHPWSAGTPRQFNQDGKTLTLRQCSRCGRDFALGLDGEGWQAAYIGVFKVQPLPKFVTQRWLQEVCPREHLPQDDADRRLVSHSQMPL